MSSLLRLPTVIERTGLSRASIYLHVAKGVMTPPVKIGDRSAAWPEDEIDAINAARIAGKTDPEIRKLVSTLQLQRTASN